MSLLARARRDARGILSGPDWSTVVTFTAPTGEIEIITATFYRVNRQSLNTEGRITNSIIAHCTVSERDLIEVYYPTRNAGDEVDFSGHILTAADEDGVERTYIAKEWHPDHTLGIIRIMLGDYVAN